MVWSQPARVAKTSHWNKGAVCLSLAPLAGIGASKSSVSRSHLLLQRYSSHSEMIIPCHPSPLEYEHHKSDLNSVFKNPCHPLRIGQFRHISVTNQSTSAKWQVLVEVQEPGKYTEKWPGKKNKQASWHEGLVMSRILPWQQIAHWCDQHLIQF